jgi:hypothetical protein
MSQWYLPAYGIFGIEPNSHSGRAAATSANCDRQRQNRERTELNHSMRPACQAADL